MIVSESAEHYEIVTQSDHAHLAAEVLGLFRLPVLIEHPRRESLLRAVREHDSGWRGADSAPRVDPSGRPLGFREVADETRREIWDRTCADAVSDDPYVALLVTLHAIRLHEDRDTHPIWSEWLTDLRQQRDQLLEASGLPPHQAAADYTWLQLSDLCSLALCGGVKGDFEAGGVRASLVEASLEGTDDGGSAVRTLRLAPFPLAGTTTFRPSCRRIERRPYASDRDLGRALATARWTHRPVTIAPAAG